MAKTYEIEVKGEVLRDEPIAQMADMLRYDSGDIVNMVETVIEGKPWKRFTAIVHLAHYTRDRWSSLGLLTKLLRTINASPPPARFESSEQVSAYLHGNT